MDKNKMINRIITIAFYLSFLPYLYIAFGSVMDFIVEIDERSVIVSLFYISIFYGIPLSIFYQLFYLCKKKNKRKSAIVFFVAFAIIAIFILLRQLWYSTH